MAWLVLLARQARLAVAEADVVLFVVNVREGASALDDDILAWLRKLSQPTLLVINKIDGVSDTTVHSEFAHYGFSDVVPVSAAHRQGLMTLLNRCLRGCLNAVLARHLMKIQERIHIAFVGRPNVGKSTLVNRLLGEERMIVSDVSGTTRDSITVDLGAR